MKSTSSVKGRRQAEIDYIQKADKLGRYHTQDINNSPCNINIFYQVYDFMCIMFCFFVVVVVVFVFMCFKSWKY